MDLTLKRLETTKNGEAWGVGGGVGHPLGDRGRGIFGEMMGRGITTGLYLKKKIKKKKTLKASELKSQVSGISPLSKAARH